MPTPQELKDKLWKALRADMTLMLGLKEEQRVLPRPMTAQTQGDHGPLWFFTAKDTVLAQALAGGPHPAIATFTSKGHDLFATVEGQLTIDTDRTVIEVVEARPPPLAISTASAAVTGTGSRDRFFHQATAFCRAKPSCWKTRRPGHWRASARGRT